MGKGNFRFRKSFTLPNGMKVNFNKDSTSFTIPAGNGNSITINPDKETQTTKINLGNGVSYVQTDSTKEKKKTTKKKEK